MSDRINWDDWELCDLADQATGTLLLNVYGAVAANGRINNRAGQHWLYRVKKPQHRDLMQEFRDNPSEWEPAEESPETIRDSFASEARKDQVCLSYRHDRVLVTKWFKRKLEWPTEFGSIVEATIAFDHAPDEPELHRWVFDGRRWLSAGMVSSQEMLELVSVIRKGTGDE